MSDDVAIAALAAELAEAMDEFVELGYAKIMPGNNGALYSFTPGGHKYMALRKEGEGEVAALRSRLKEAEGELVAAKSLMHRLFVETEYLGDTLNEMDAVDEEEDHLEAMGKVFEEVRHCLRGVGNRCSGCGFLPGPAETCSNCAFLAASTQGTPGAAKEGE